MDSKRAYEILNSKDNIQVSYNGTSVWIESINGHQAQVKNLKNNHLEHVSVDDLKEIN